MDKFSRSKSSRDGSELQPRNMNDLRSYSTSDYNQNPDYNFKQVKISKSKIGSASSSSSGSSKSWSFDPELQRKKRVAGYKAYGVEGKMKTSFTKSFRWIKDICNGIW